MKKIGTINGNDIVERDDGSVTFSAGATLDGDGANGQFGQPPCYAPPSFHGPTLDVLANAGHPGNWYGVVTETGDEKGTPIVQKATDPCPGADFFHSSFRNCRSPLGITERNLCGKKNLPQKAV